MRADGSPGACSGRADEGESAGDERLASSARVDRGSEGGRRSRRCACDEDGRDRGRGGAGKESLGRRVGVSGCVVVRA